LFIVEVDDNAKAAQRGLRPGDLIQAVGRDEVASPEQVVDKIEAAKKAGRKMILFRVERDGAAQFMAVPLG
jgi:serine protease Do